MPELALKYPFPRMAISFFLRGSAGAAMMVELYLLSPDYQTDDKEQQSLAACRKFAKSNIRRRTKQTEKRNLQESTALKYNILTPKT
jgi:uncharacterized membrane protein YgaE (UPF0421/DUF939 family)